MVFRLEMVSALDLPQDAVFLLFLLEKAPQVESHRREVYRKERLREKSGVERRACLIFAHGYARCRQSQNQFSVELLWGLALTEN
jgi:hypothetical protein